MAQYVARQFLNLLGEGNAFVSASANTDELTAELTIADCNRQITLDFSVWAEEDLENVRHKATLLRTVVGNLLDHVDYTIAHFSELREAQNKTRAERRRARAALIDEPEL